MAGLHDAVAEDNIVLVRELLSSGPDINAKGIGGRTPLHYAQSPEMAKLLLDAGANIDARNMYGNTPLVFIASTRDALDSETTARYVATIKVLLDAGADLNAGCNGTALHLVSNGEIAKALVEAGVDPHAANRFGCTPLHNNVHVDVAKILLGAGADPNARDEFGCTPLHYAQNVEVVEALLKAGGDPNATGNSSATPLFYASSPEVAKALIAAGADVNAVNNYRQTPVFRANSAAIAKVLIDAGANMRVRNNKGQTPLQDYRWWFSRNLVPTRGFDPSPIAALLIQRAWRSRYLRRQAAARCIQAAWERCAYNPRYALCRRRLEAVYTRLASHTS